MPSPFPGMNPYLEQPDAWQDFHDRYIPELSDALAPLVNPHFIVKIQEHLYIHEPPGEQRIRIGSGDVSLSRSGESAGAVATVAASAPSRVIIPLVDIEKENYFEIRDHKTRELVAVIELLSPTNKKPGPDREQYLAKRANLLRSSAHFVEIDLLRAWPRMPMERAEPCDYCVLVSAVDDRPEAGFWPIRLRQRLPVVSIPLRDPIPEVSLDLQRALDAVYDRAYYRSYIYDSDPIPPLSADDATWAATLIRTQQRETAERASSTPD